MIRSNRDVGAGRLRLFGLVLRPFWPRGILLDSSTNRRLPLAGNC